MILHANGLFDLTELILQFNFISKNMVNSFHNLLEYIYEYTRKVTVELENYSRIC